jgi:ribosomal protein S18 acetylase RimI-like enzyme
VRFRRLSNAAAPICFPAGRAELPTLSAALQLLGIRVRRAHTDDLPFLRELYGNLRADELAQVPWPPSAKDAFLDSQFDLQHRHFVNHFAAADFLLLEQHGVAIGRYYLLRAQPYFLIVEIALQPGSRQCGIGSALLDWAKHLVQTEAAEGIDLHVDERNLSAQRLYTRHGFIETERSSPYIGMRWSRCSIEHAI